MSKIRAKVERGGSEGIYIVIEGQDTTGKSTQVELLADFFRKQNRPVVTMHEPDGELEVARQLNRVIKDKNLNLEPFSYVLLFTVARLELWRKLAEPILAENGVVISSRNYWSTLAFQGYGQGVSRRKIMQITNQMMPTRYLKPDYATIFTLDETERLSRQSKCGRDPNADTFESKPSDFQDKVNRAYVKIAEEFGVPMIDANDTIEGLSRRILELFGFESGEG